MFFGVKYSE